MPDPILSVTAFNFITTVSLAASLTMLMAGFMQLQSSEQVEVLKGPLKLKMRCEQQWKGHSCASKTTWCQVRHYEAPLLTTSLLEIRRMAWPET